MTTIQTNEQDARTMRSLLFMLKISRESLAFAKAEGDQALERMALDNIRKTEERINELTRSTIHVEVAP